MSTTELGGMVLGMAVLAASTLFSRFNEPVEQEQPQTEQATTMFNNSYEATNSMKIDCVYLSQRLGDKRGTLALQSALAQLGVSMEISSDCHHGIVDLTFLIDENPTFLAERKLFSALTSAGLLLAPGEALGMTTPGKFRVYCPEPIGEKTLHKIKTRMARVIHQFRRYYTMPVPLSPPPAVPVITDSTTNSNGKTLTNGNTGDHSATNGSSNGSGSGTSTTNSSRKRPADTSTSNVPTTTTTGTTNDTPFSAPTAVPTTTPSSKKSKKASSDTGPKSTSKSAKKATKSS